MATILLKQGDTLGALAQQQGTTVSALIDANRNNPAALPDPNNPNLILAGATLNLPEADVSFQGPVPLGTSEELFRATGVSEPITSETVIPTAEVPFVSTIVAPPPVVPPPTPVVAPTVEPTVTEPTTTDRLETLQSEIVETDTLTPEQRSVQTQIQEIRDLVTQTLGRETFRAEKETAVKLPELQATQRDLTAQLNALVNEAAGIPLGLTTLQAKRSGISTAGITSLQGDDLRENAIKSLMVSALLEGVNGNIATALDAVDRAVAAKYGPIQEEIDVKIRNLELFLESPEFTASEKKQAQAQLDTQNTLKQKAEDQRDEQLEIWNISVTAAQNGATADVLRQIQDAQTKEEALRIATQLGVTKGAQLPTADEKPLSINQIEQFRRSFGWTPPLGFTQSQLIQYMNDNPNATPEELESV